MSSTRYLEFDSTYRDRNLYPEPSNFIVEMSQSGQGTKLTARDPVSDASPILIWNNNFIAGPTGSQNITDLTASPSPGNMGITIFEIKAANPQLKQVRNFYVGCSLKATVFGTTYVRRIVDYQPLDLTRAMVTLDSALPDSLVGVPAFSIENPSPISTNTSNATIKFYIPGSNKCIDPIERTQHYGLGSDNYYINYYIMNTDTGTKRLITAFDAVTRLATLDSPTPVGEDWTSSAYYTSNFVIRKAIPIETSGSSTGSTPIVFATTQLIQLQDPSNGTVTGRYDGDFLRINPLQNAPSPYNVTTSPPYDSTIVSAYPANCQTEERRIQRFVYGRGLVTSLVGGSPTTTVILDTNASSGTEYIGALISNTSVTGALPSYYYPQTAKIVDYNGATKQVTTDVPIIWAVGDTWMIRTCILSSPFSVQTNPQNHYEIELFTKDNYNPFVYTGSLVSSQEVVCYEVELLNLILPNAILASGRGGRPIFYPYLYVELQQISSAGSTNNNIIYSNNPHSYRMLYRAVVDDTPIPAVSPFIKIDGDGMVHVVKFKPNDSFRFAVFHANGEPFKTVLDEQYSPSAPNPLTQISVCFAFKRV